MTQLMTRVSERIWFKKRFGVRVCTSVIADLLSFYFGTKIQVQASENLVT